MGGGCKGLFWPKGFIAEQKLRSSENSLFFAQREMMFLLGARRNPIQNNIKWEKTFVDGLCSYPLNFLSKKKKEKETTFLLISRWFLHLGLSSPWKKTHSLRDWGCFFTRLVFGSHLFYFFFFILYFGPNEPDMLEVAAFEEIALESVRAYVEGCRWKVN